MRKTDRTKLIKLLKKIIVRLEKNDIEIKELTIEEINPEDIDRGLYQYKGDK